MTEYNYEENRKSGGTQINATETTAFSNESFKLKEIFWGYCNYRRSDLCGPASEWVCFEMQGKKDGRNYLLKVSKRKELSLESVAGQIPFIIRAGRLQCSDGRKRFACVEPLCKSVALAQELKKDPKGTVRRLAEMLDRFHRSCIHGDLKPEHIVWLDGRFEACDWSCAQAVRDRNDKTGTVFVQGENGEAGFTLEYAPPERLGSGLCGRGTDLYAAGIILYQAATGIKPYADLSAEECLRQKNLGFRANSVQDNNLRRLIEGLTTDLNHRFTTAEMYLYANGKDIADTYRKHQDQNTVSSYFPYRIGHTECWSFDELAVSLLRNPDDALRQMRAEVLSQWLIRAGRQDAAAYCALSQRDYGTVSATAYALTQTRIIEICYANKRFKNSSDLGERLREEQDWEMLVSMCRAGMFSAYFSQNGFHTSENFRLAIRNYEKKIASGTSLEEKILFTYLITPTAGRTFEFRNEQFRNPEEFMKWFASFEYETKEAIASELNHGTASIPFKCWMKACT